MNKIINYIRHRYQQVSIFVLFLISTILIVTAFPKQSVFFPNYQSGEVWKNKDLKAQFDFPIIKNDDELKKNEAEVIRKTPVYYRQDTNIKNIPLQLLMNDLSENWEESAMSLEQQNVIRGLLISEKQDSIAKAKHIRIGVKILEELFDDGIFEMTKEHEDSEFDRTIFLERGNKLKAVPLSEILTLSKAIDKASIDLRKFKNIDADFLLNNIVKYIKYNTFYDQKRTEEEEKRNLAKIITKKGKIKAGELLIANGEIVSNQKKQILDSYKKSLGKRASSKRYWLVLLGQSLTVALCLLAVLFFIRLFEPAIFDHLGQVFFILMLNVITAYLFNFVLKIDELSVYLIPICIYPIVLRAFYKVELAIFLHIILVFIISFMVPNPYEFILLHSIAGALLMFGISNQTRRSQFFNSALIIFVSYAITYFGISLQKTGDITSTIWTNFGWFGGNAILSMFAFPLVYLFEKSFGLLSEMTLLELADSNSPLLRELNEKAPGTFQHSSQVANLAEEAVRIIHGDVLLVRAGAMYHDIGKISAPEYFIENQTSNYNPHDDLDYEESAKIIVNHVLYGIELAKAHNLPDQILSFIRTHHGTSRVEYFYRMKVKEVGEENVNPADYTYPGPLPFSKETAVLMMADSVEAASRSIKNINADKIENLVEKIIGSQMNSGQFIQADITFKEITKIKKIFIHKLKNIYHVRIEYPD